MRILITGMSGFVGSHFIDHLGEVGIDADVLGLSRRPWSHRLCPAGKIRLTTHAADLLDRRLIRSILEQFRPTHVLHLAAYSSVGFSWQKPVESFSNNTNILLNLLDLVRDLRIPCRILSVGSSEEYGPVSADMLPLREQARLNPISPYAVARVAQELLSSVYVHGYGLDIVMTRSFNHIGTRQREDFVVPSLAKQLVERRVTGNTAPLTTGNRAIIRDFVDVRDVVRAYLDLLRNGRPGQVYNICSGNGVSIDDVIMRMQRCLGTDVPLRTDPNLVRPAENPAVIGAYDRIFEDIGWKPRVALDDSLSWILDWWHAQRGTA